MSARESAAELQRVAQAIALSEAFQLLVLECEGLPPGGLQRLLDEIQRQVAALRGVPPLFVIYDPRLVTDWFPEMLGTMTELPRPTEAGASIVAVIDGTDTSGRHAQAGRDDDWQFLFQRINERRNAIGRSLGGTMILALSPARGRMFLEEAPDLASIRSGTFRFSAEALRADFQPALAPVALKAWYSPAILREVALRRVAANPSLTDEARRMAFMQLHGGDPSLAQWAPMAKGTRRLYDILAAAFSADELRRFVHYNYPELALSLPGNQVASREYAWAVVDELTSRGMIDRGLFDRLLVERPHRQDIVQLAESLGYAPRRHAQDQATVSAPSDLFDALLRLTATQREQVMYLAGFAGGDVVMRVMRGRRERPPTSAREILERAREGGAEGLARLAEAIGIVTASE